MLDHGVPRYRAWGEGRLMRDLYLRQVILLATAASLVVVLVRRIIIRKLKNAKPPNPHYPLRPGELE